VNPGDTVEAETEYVYDTVYMWVTDETTGNSKSVALQYYASEPVSYYYDGSTADFITEAPGKAGGGMYELRQPHLKTTKFTVATVNNGTPISNFNSWNEVEINGSDLMQDSSYDGIHSWLDTWENCI